MDARAIYELVKGHEDVWGKTLGVRTTGKYPVFTRSLLGPNFGRSRITNEFAVLVLEALFARAMGCGVSYNHPTDENVNEGDEPRWFAFDHNGDVWCFAQPSRLEALVRAREAGKERGE